LPAHNGKSLSEIARALNQDPWDVFFAIARTGAFAMPQSMSEANKIKAMQQDFVSFDTDAGPAPSPERGNQSRQDGATRSGAVSHPRAFGAFPRVLARYVRDWRIDGRAIQDDGRGRQRDHGYDRGRLATGLAATSSSSIRIQFGIVRLSASQMWCQKA
jgi:N-acyl-D-aspartate/D-glutamate deacylase